MLSQLLSDISTSQQSLPIWIHSLAPGIIPAGVCELISQDHPDLPLLTPYPHAHANAHTPSSLPHLPHFVLACPSSHLSHHQCSVIQPSSYLSPLLSALLFWCWGKTCARGWGGGWGGAGLVFFAIDALRSAGTSACFTAPSVMDADVHTLWNTVLLSSIRFLECFLFPVWKTFSPTAPEIPTISSPKANKKPSIIQRFPEIIHIPHLLYMSFLF